MTLRATNLGGHPSTAAREGLHRASYQLASVQATLQNRGEAINDDARVAADLDLEDVRSAIVVALSFIK